MWCKMWWDEKIEKSLSLYVCVCVCVCRSTLAVDRATNFPNCHGDNVIRKTWDFLGIDKAMTSSCNRDLRYFDASETLRFREYTTEFVCLFTRVVVMFVFMKVFHIQPLLQMKFITSVLVLVYHTFILYM